MFHPISWTGIGSCRRNSLQGPRAGGNQKGVGKLFSHQGAPQGFPGRQPPGGQGAVTGEGPSLRRVGRWVGTDPRPSRSRKAVSCSFQSLRAPSQVGSRRPCTHPSLRQGPAGPQALGPGG